MEDALGVKSQNIVPRTGSWTFTTILCVCVCVYVDLRFSVYKFIFCLNCEV